MDGTTPIQKKNYRLTNFLSSQTNHTSNEDRHSKEAWSCPSQHVYPKKPMVEQTR